MPDRPDTRPSAGFARPGAAAHAPLPVPLPVVPDRGRIIDSVTVAERFMGGLVKEKYVRDNFPYKIDLGQSRVGWHEQTVKEVLEYAERHNVRVPDVRLPHLEQLKRKEQEKDAKRGDGV